MLRTRRTMKFIGVPPCGFLWKSVRAFDGADPDEIHRCSRPTGHKKHHTCNCGTSGVIMSERKETHDNLAEILKKKRDAEEKEEKQRAERLQQAYLKRTGRTEMKP